MSLFTSILVIYLFSCFHFNWGGWCVLSCFLSLIFILIGSNYYYYYLCREWFGLDKLSFIIVVLCFLILGVRLVRRCKDLKFNKLIYDRKTISISELLIIICLGGIFFFTMCSLIDFFFFFEFSLIPTFWLILKWGYQPERLQAGLYMVMYTVSASLPLLLRLVFFWSLIGRDNILLIKFIKLKLIKKTLRWVWVCVSLAFFVKLPIYFFHGWLPKAHVEAPLSGSIVLAGILLKFGVYGVIRVLWVIQFPILQVILWVIVFSLWGGVIRSCVCSCQRDLKSLIAYSSIGHIAVSLGGVLRIYCLGKISRICLLLAHGLVSPVLFSLSARVYDVVGSRRVVLSKGILRIFPIITLFWFLYCIFNIGFPPSLNFFREVFCVASVIWYNIVLSLPSGLILFLAGCYSLILYRWVNHGVIRISISPIWGLSSRYLFRGIFILNLLIFSFLMLDFFFV